MPDEPNLYRITLRAVADPLLRQGFPARPVDVRLRAALKVLKRGFGLACAQAVEVPKSDQHGEDSPMGIKFLDGPAAGELLSLGRCPLYLRVTHHLAGDGAHTFDALDQLDDRPDPAEEVWAYKKASDDGWVHYDYTDKQGRRRGRTEQLASYAYLYEQPPEDVLRDNAKWAAWAAEQARKEAPAP